MNLFEFKIADIKLDTLKTKKAKLEFIRWVHADVTSGNSSYDSINPSSANFEELSLQAQLLNKAFTMYDGDVPLFLYDTVNALNSKVLMMAIRCNIPADKVEEATKYISDTRSNSITYTDLSQFLYGAVNASSRLSLKAKKQLLDIVRNSCEPSTLCNTDT